MHRPTGIAGRDNASNARLFGANDLLFECFGRLGTAQAEVDHVDGVVDAVFERIDQLADLAAGTVKPLQPPATGELATVSDLRKSGATGTEEASPFMPFFLERYGQAYRAELEAFAHSIRTGAPCSPSFDDGVTALVLANAAAESAATGKTVTVARAAAPSAG